MVKLRGPVYSLSARGWLGKGTYYRTGYVAHPYPIALLPRHLTHSIYYSKTGWVYQMRRTWHGIQPTALRGYLPANPRTAKQQANRTKFANAVAAWQALPQADKDDYESRSKSRHMSGYNLYLRDYMLDKV